MAKMLKTVWAEDEDGRRHRLVKGTEAPDWYDGGRFVEGGEPATSEGASHPATGAQEGGQPMSGEQLVQGSVDVVTARVAGDPDKARQALEAEQAGQRRSTLIAALENVIEDGE